MEQKERIIQMEQRMERAAAAVMSLSAALDRYEEVQEDISALKAYSLFLSIPNTPTHVPTQATDYDERQVP